MKVDLIDYEKIYILNFFIFKMTEIFPRKVVYVSTSHSPLGEGNVSAIHDRMIFISDSLREYAERKWSIENVGRFSSVIPSAVDVEQNENSMRIHCGLTEYKMLLGMVKMALERERTGLSENIHGLSTEIMPLTLDKMFFLDKRSDAITQHGVGFYDIPTAGQSAQIYLKKAFETGPDLIKGKSDTDKMLDMFGFPRWNLVRHLGLNQDEIGDIFYTGFSRGFEVSLDSQFNGFARVIPEAREIMRRSNEESRLVYRLEDVLDILSSIGNNGEEGQRLKEDIYGNTPVPNGNGFRIIDDCLGTLLSNTFHLRGVDDYFQALDILKKKDYDVIEVPQGIIHLDDLN
tara:strand:- start:38961 stop:39995 length:1035 start_codon:yes stop_codon:yes gene_type:complete